MHSQHKVYVIIKLSILFFGNYLENIYLPLPSYTIKIRTALARRIYSTYTLTSSTCVFIWFAAHIPMKVSYHSITLRYVYVFSVYISAYIPTLQAANTVISFWEITTWTRCPINLLGLDVIAPVSTLIALNVGHSLSQTQPRLQYFRQHQWW